MRKTYKNKRDQYKAELEQTKGELTRKQMVLDSVSKQFEDYKKKQSEAKKKRYSATVYCKNCMYVHNVEIPPAMTIAECDCVNCWVKGQLLPVVYYPGR